MNGRGEEAFYTKALFFFSSLNEDWKNPDPHSFRKLDMTFG